MITADLGIPRKATDVIAVELGCGHIIGEEEYKRFAAARQKILTRLEAEKRALQEKANAELTSAYKAMRESKEAR